MSQKTAARSFQPDRLNDDVLYSAKEAAFFLGRSPRTLELWRRQGIGPRVTRIHSKALPHYLGRHIRETIEGPSRRARISGDFDVR